MMSKYTSESIKTSLSRLGIEPRPRVIIDYDDSYYVVSFNDCSLKFLSSSSVLDFINNNLFVL